MRIRSLALALTATLVIGSTAGAAVVTYKSVVSPSGLIGCLALKYGGPGIECFAPYLPPGKYGTDPYYELHPHGRSIVGERGDYPGYPGVKRHKLHYGDTWKRPGIRCSMERNGLTCHNLDHHGFHIEKGHLRRF